MTVFQNEVLAFLHFFDCRDLPLNAFLWIIGNVVLEVGQSFFKGAICRFHVFVNPLNIGIYRGFQLYDLFLDFVDQTLVLNSKR